MLSQEKVLVTFMCVLELAEAWILNRDIADRVRFTVLHPFFRHVLDFGGDDGDSGSIRNGDRLSGLNIL